MPKVKNVFTPKRVNDFETQKQRQQVYKEKTRPPDPVLKLVSSKPYYHKKCFNKYQVWIPKGSMEKLEIPKGKWMDITLQDDHGRPKTIEAWVLNV